MAITVKHLKVSTIPDSGDDTLIEPSDWNADHQLTGTVPVANGGTGAATLTGYVKGNGTSAMTAASTIPNTDITGLGTASTKDAGVANGVATLDSGGKVPVSELPAAVLGALSYQGTWNASTNTPTLTSSVGTKGYYYVVSVAGSTNLDGITDWLVGDWAVYNGTVWQKVDNTESVSSVNGQTGAVVLTTTNIAEGTNLYYTDARARAALSAGTGISYNSTTGVITNSSPSLGGDVVGPASATDNAIARYDTTTGKLIQNSVVTIDDTGNVSGILSEQLTATTAPSYSQGLMWYDSTAKAVAYYNDSTGIKVHVGQDLIVKVINNTGSTIANGSPVYITSTSSGQTYPNIALAKADVAATSAVIGLTNGAIANGSIGYVTSQGGIDGVNTGSYTVGQVLYLSPYSAGQLMNTIPPTGITVQVGVVSYVDSSNGKIYVKQTTPLAVPASIITGTLGVANGGTGATTLTGYVKGSGTSAMTASSTIPTTDLSGTITNAQLANSAITINGTSTSLGGSINVGTVTSVTGTAPISSSGGATPAISISQASGTTNGYLSSTDWTTFNNKTSNTGTVTSVAASVPSFLSVSGSPITTSGTLAITYSGTALPIANGGTNATSYTAPSGNVNPLVFYNGTSFATDATTVTDAGYDTVTNTLNCRQLQANNGIICNSTTISSSFSIPSGSSAMSTGPITIASGVTVTVPSGGKWVVL